MRKLFISLLSIYFLTSSNTYAEDEEITSCGDITDASMIDTNASIKSERQSYKYIFTEEDANVLPPSYYAEDYRDQFKFQGSYNSNCTCKDNQYKQSISTLCGKGYLCLAKGDTCKVGLGICAKKGTVSCPTGFNWDNSTEKCISCPIEHEWKSELNCCLINNAKETCNGYGGNLINKTCYICNDSERYIYNHEGDTWCELREGKSRQDSDDEDGKEAYKVINKVKFQCVSATKKTDLTCIDSSTQSPLKADESKKKKEGEGISGIDNNCNGTINDGVYSCDDSMTPQRITDYKGHDSEGNPFSCSYSHFPDAVDAKGNSYFFPYLGEEDSKILSDHVQSMRDYANIIGEEETDEPTYIRDCKAKSKQNTQTTEVLSRYSDDVVNKYYASILYNWITYYYNYLHNEKIKSLIESQKDLEKYQFNSDGTLCDEDKSCNFNYTKESIKNWLLYVDEDITEINEKNSDPKFHSASIKSLAQMCYISNYKNLITSQTPSTIGDKSFSGCGQYPTGSNDYNSCVNNTKDTLKDACISLNTDKAKIQANIEQTYLLFLDPRINNVVLSELVNNINKQNETLKLTTEQIKTALYLSISNGKYKAHCNNLTLEKCRTNRSSILYNIRYTVLRNFMYNILKKYFNEITVGGENAATYKENWSKFFSNLTFPTLTSQNASRFQIIYYTNNNKTENYKINNKIKYYYSYYHKPEVSASTNQEDYITTSYYHPVKGTDNTYSISKEEVKSSKIYNKNNDTSYFNLANLTAAFTWNDIECPELKELRNAKNEYLNYYDLICNKEGGVNSICEAYDENYTEKMCTGTDGGTNYNEENCYSLSNANDEEIKKCLECHNRRDCLETIDDYDGTSEIIKKTTEPLKTIKRNKDEDHYILELLSTNERQIGNNIIYSRIWGACTPFEESHLAALKRMKLYVSDGVWCKPDFSMVKSFLRGYRERMSGSKIIGDMSGLARRSITDGYSRSTYKYLDVNYYKYTGTSSEDNYTSSEKSYGTLSLIFSMYNTQETCDGKDNNLDGIIDKETITVPLLSGHPDKEYGNTIQPVRATTYTYTPRTFTGTSTYYGHFISQIDDPSLEVWQGKNISCKRDLDKNCLEGTSCNISSSTIKLDCMPETDGILACNQESREVGALMCKQNFPNQNKKETCSGKENDKNCNGRTNDILAKKCYINGGQGKKGTHCNPSGRYACAITTKNKKGKAKYVGKKICTNSYYEKDGTIDMIEITRNNKIIAKEDLKRKEKKGLCPTQFEISSDNFDDTLFSNENDKLNYKIDIIDGVTDKNSAVKNQCIEGTITKNYVQDIWCCVKEDILNSSYPNKYTACWKIIPEADKTYTNGDSCEITIQQNGESSAINGVENYQCCVSNNGTMDSSNCQNFTNQEIINEGSKTCCQGGKCIYNQQNCTNQKICDSTSSPKAGIIVKRLLDDIVFCGDGKEICDKNLYNPRNWRHYQESSCNDWYTTNSGTCSCNGRDDDCNKKIDENMKIGKKCRTKQGQGKYQCNSTGQGKECFVSNLQASTIDDCPNNPFKSVAENSDDCGIPFSSTDSDNDMVPDYLDECPNNPHKHILAPDSICGDFSNKLADSDEDGVPDYLDECVFNPSKSRVVWPYNCGDSLNATDSDKDGIPDYLDECPDNQDKSEAGVCGCEEEDNDDNKNGIIDCVDKNSDTEKVLDNEDMVIAPYLTLTKDKKLRVRMEYHNTVTADYLEDFKNNKSVIKYETVLVQDIQGTYANKIHITKKPVTKFTLDDGVTAYTVKYRVLLVKDDTTIVASSWSPSKTVIRNKH